MFDTPPRTIEGRHVSTLCFDCKTLAIHVCVCGLWRVALQTRHVLSVRGKGQRKRSAKRLKVWTSALMARRHLKDMVV